MLSDKVQSLIEYSRQNGRICPQPKFWNELWELLPKKNRNASVGREPPLSLILGAWWYATGLEKMLSLRDHICWADEHDVIDQVDTFLRNLSEEEWFHGSD